MLFIKMVNTISNYVSSEGNVCHLESLRMSLDLGKQAHPSKLPM